jgi:hypothetical protein
MITIETILLVAIWDEPFIFQGFFKIASQDKQQDILYFFKCINTDLSQLQIKQGDFVPRDYEFNYIYNQISLSNRYYLSMKWH